MRRFLRIAPIAVTLLLVAAVVWFATRPSARPAAKSSPSPSATGPCQLAARSIAPGATIITPDWKVGVTEVRSSVDLPAEGGGVFHAETGKEFVVGRLTMTRTGASKAIVDSNVSIRCSGGGGVTPGYWST